MRAAKKKTKKKKRTGTGRDIKQLDLKSEAAVILVPYHH